MKFHSVWMLFAFAACSDKGDDSSGGGDGGDDSSVDDSAVDDSGTPAEDADKDGYDVDSDCNDGDPAIHPGATEVCDGVDNDCADGIDVGAADATDYFVDSDADGYGTGAATSSCEVLKGQVTTDGDCDDENKAINPSAVEVCDDLDTDEDCDTLVDDEDDSVDLKTATLFLYADADGDGYGVTGSKIQACDVGGGLSSNADDCDDASGAIHPFAAEVCDDANDEDCDGVADACRFSDEIDATDADAHLLGYDSLYLGYDVSPAGDMNGDGFGDIAVATNSGKGAFVFAGPIGGSMGAADALAKFDRPASGVSIGDDVQGIHDQDGDGYDDLLVSSSGSSVGYIELGPVSGAESIDKTADATITGDAGDYMSWYPSAGDVNGDGVFDPMLGAPASNGSYGAAYIFFGPVTSGDLTAADAGASFIGLNSNDWTGGCNAANGDVNGDGIDDVLVSAEQSDYGDPSNTFYDDGLAYLFYGPVSGEYSVKEADTRFLGGAAGTHLGWFSTLGGDVDGDGSYDVTLSAPNTGDGTVYVAYSTQIKGVSDFDVAKAGATIIGDPGYSQKFGYYLDTAGDLDTDGNDDLAVGSYPSNGYLGTAWTYYGPITGALEATADASFVMYGTSTIQYVGASTVFVHDVTGDGADDLAIGAHNAILGKGTIYGAGMVMLLNGTTP
jgi:hypothetical protein